MRRLLAVIPIFSALPLFWCLMNQQGSTWILQADAMDNHVSIPLPWGSRFSFDIEPEQMSILNPIFLFALLPFLEWLFRRNARISLSNNNSASADAHSGRGRGNIRSNTAVAGSASTIAAAHNSGMDANSSAAAANVDGGDGDGVQSSSHRLLLASALDSSNSNSPRYNNNEDDDNDDDDGVDSNNSYGRRSAAAAGPGRCARCCSRLSPRPLTKMALGMVFAGVAYAFASLAERSMALAAPQRVSILWQVPQYFCVTVAEVLISVTCMNFAYVVAPKQMKALVSALLMASSAIGDLATAAFYSLFTAMGVDRDVMFALFAACMVVNLLYFRFLMAKFEFLNDMK